MAECGVYIGKIAKNKPRMRGLHRKMAQKWLKIAILTVFKLKSMVLGVKSLGNLKKGG